MKATIDHKKKDTERRYVNLFKARYAEFPEGEIEDHEPLDFIVHSVSGTVGIEVENYYIGTAQGKGSRGSPVQRETSERGKFAIKAKEEFEKLDSRKLDVIFYFLDSKLGADKSLAKTAAELIKKVAPQQAGSIEIDWRTLKDTRLEDYLGTIRIRSAKQAQWQSRESLWLGTPIQELQNNIAAKEAKIDEYLKQSSRLWLLLVSDEAHLSSTADPPLDVTSHTFTTRFERVVMFWTASGRILQLRVNHP